MTRHEFFLKRLNELGFYDKGGDEGGLIGKSVEQLSAIFDDFGRVGLSGIQTMRIFNLLMEEWDNPRCPEAHVTDSDPPKTTSTGAGTEKEDSGAPK